MNITIDNISFSKISELTEHVVGNYRHKCVSEGSQAFYNAFIGMLVKVDEGTDDRLLQQFIEANLDLINNNKNLDVEQLSLRTLLLNACPKSSPDELTLYVLAHEQLNTLSKDAFSKWQKIILTLHRNAPPEAQVLLLTVAANLGKCGHLLNQLVKLFEESPHPSLVEFASNIEKNLKGLGEYISQFDKDPARNRLPKGEELVDSIQHASIIQQQFSLGNLKQVLKGIQSLGDDSVLSMEQRYELAQQVVYINAIGLDEPFKVGTKSYEPLVKQGRDALKQIYADLLAELRSPATNEKARCRAELKLLAVLREQYYRTSGLQLSDTQLASILLALQNRQEHTLIELASKEDTSQLTPVLAAMQWAIGGGDTVNVCIAKKEMQQTEMYRPSTPSFYTSLGIPFSILHAASIKGTYQIGGINITSVPELADYMERARAEGESLSTTKGGASVSSHLILVEPDITSVSYNNYSEHAVLKQYKEQGHLIGVSGPHASQHKMNEQCVQLGIGHVYQIPDMSQIEALELDAQSIMRKEEFAFQKDILQSVSVANQVVMEQFENWKAFLHMVIPKSGWQELDGYLVQDGNQLLESLSRSWVDSLRELHIDCDDTGNFVKRDLQGDIPKSTLDAAVRLYEEKAAMVWDEKRLEFYNAVSKDIEDGSLNAARRKYLMDTNFRSQLQLKKIELLQEEQFHEEAVKRDALLLDTAFDVNAAMLKYSDANSVKKYRAPYLKTHITLLAHELSNQINKSSISDIQKQSLVSRLDNASAIFTVALVLLDFAKVYLPSASYIEKYRLQPVIREMLRVNKLAGLAETREIQQVKQLYLDNALLDIANNLESTLSWAQPSNRGLGYWLERSLVKDAANEILPLTAELKKVANSADIEAKQVALKKLYSALANNQTKLEGLWIISLGHKNTRHLINQSVSAIHELSAIGGNETLSSEFMETCKLDVHYESMKQKIDLSISDLENQHGRPLSSNIVWTEIKKQIQTIQKGQGNIFNLQEMQSILTKKIATTPADSKPLFDALNTLKQNISSLWGQFEAEHSITSQRTAYLRSRATNLQTQLAGVEGYNVKEVRVRERLGRSDVFDLVIEGSGAIPPLDDFARYQTRLPELNREQDSLKQLLKECQLQTRGVEERLKIVEQVGSFSEGGLFDVKQFSANHQARIAKILKFKVYMKETTIPENLADFPEAIRNHFSDRHFMQSLELDTLTIEQIGQIKDEGLRAELRDLYSKLHPAKPEKPESRFTALKNGFWDFFSRKETLEDLIYQFNEFRTRSDGRLKYYLQEEIQSECKGITNELRATQSELMRREGSLGTQIQFNTEKVIEEEQKPNTLFKRFNTVEELYQFEAQVSAYRTRNPKLIDKEVENGIGDASKVGQIEQVVLV